MDSSDLFAGLTDREIAQAVVFEMRRRELYGCVFFVPHGGGPSVFGSSSPQGTMAEYPVATQLAIFAEVALEAKGERQTRLPAEVPEPKGWVN